MNQIDFLGGFFGGVVSTYVGHPMDTIKVRMQVILVSLLIAVSDQEQTKPSYSRGVEWAYNGLTLLVVGLVEFVPRALHSPLTRSKRVSRCNIHFESFL